MRKHMILLAVMLSASSLSFAGGANSEKMENTLARGYLAASKNDVEGALKAFTESVPLAEKAGSWRGLVDAGNAFSVLGKPDLSVNPFKKAERIAFSQKDWRGIVSVAYGYAALPDDRGGKKLALSGLEKASSTASAQKEWRGLVETARAYSAFGAKGRSEKDLQAAKNIVAGLKYGPAAAELSGKAKELGFMTIADECAKMAKDLGADTAKPQAPPPPGWKPYGESVAGPQKISVEAQTAMRASADKDVESKRAYLAATEKKEEKSKQYYVSYQGYYDSPYQSRYYGFGYNSALTAAQISGWSGYCMSRYRRDNNNYVYIY